MVNGDIVNPSCLNFKHIPVLLKECLDALQLKKNMVVVDATLGGAGHSREIVKQISGGTLVGLDRDTAALQFSAQILNAAQNVEIRLIKCNFCDIADVLPSLGIDSVDAILADFGVSSYQIDTLERGFSYTQDAPLDMRMDTDANKTADTVVNSYPEGRLADLIWQYGEERYARKIAAAIVAARPIRSTGHLVEVIKNAVPAGYGKTGGHPAKRTFQAIRIEVNQELESIQKFLDGAIKMLKPHGRLAVISFHSLEDRIVKQTFKREATDCLCPPKIPQCICGHKATVKLLTKKPICPTIEETKSNPRSASAKLRVVCKL
ncbi:MAG: 16S rRNA (cytosine(1402)-N(4))-methyltransferase RsmH [Clostridia bacterium]|nr:16S rRNA (cytosine(1402)-N(4))-methyltransferase RsmH [Clostridia bacterium]